MNNWEQLFAEHFHVTQQRTAAALEKVSADYLITFSGCPVKVFQDDWNYPFVVNHWFKIWCPEAHPFCFVISNGQDKPVMIYFQPEDYWHAVAGEPQGFWTNFYQLEVVGDFEQIKSILKQYPSAQVLGDDIPLLREWGLTSFNNQKIIDYLSYHRAYKTDYEIESMQLANDMAAKAHLVARDAFLEGKSELNIHLDYLASVNCRESKLPYNNIIACDHNTAVLHYDDYRNSTAGVEHKSLLVDAGAQVHGYASDITRSWARQAGEYAELYSALDKAQLKLIDEISLGESYVSTHERMHQYTAELLQQFGFIDLSADSIYEQRLTQYFFPHGIGHFIGGQVHDVGGKIADEKGTAITQPDGHPFLRLLRPVEERQVFTIEPGLYMIEQLLKELRQSDNAKFVNWQKVESFKAFGGVRVEDCVLVTGQGIRNLSRDAFAKVQM